MHAPLVPPLHPGHTPDAPDNVQEPTVLEPAVGGQAVTAIAQQSTARVLMAYHYGWSTVICFFNILPQACVT